LTRGLHDPEFNWYVMGKNKMGVKVRIAGFRYWKDALSFVKGNSVRSDYTIVDKDKAF
jgi:hypothetical protein